MGWLRVVGSFKLWVSFAENRLFYRAFLQKRRIISRSLLKGFFAKETYNFKEPTNRSHPILHRAHVHTCRFSRGAFAMVLGLFASVTSELGPSLPPCTSYTATALVTRFSFLPKFELSLDCQGQTTPLLCCSCAAITECLSTREKCRCPDATCGKCEYDASWKV